MLREDARRLDCAKRATIGSRLGNVRSQRRSFPTAQPSRRFADPVLPTYVRDWFAHREPGAYWNELDISTRIDRIRVFPRCTSPAGTTRILKARFAGYLALRNGAGSEFARENQYSDRWPLGAYSLGRPRRR
jgi:hypothetical protein